MISSGDVRTIEAWLQPLIGRAVWGARVGVGSFLFLEFGDPVTVPMRTVDAFTKGEWHLWLYETAWRIQVGRALQGGSGDTSMRKQQLQRTVELLNGLRLEAVSIAPLSGDTMFRFDNDTQLHTFSMNGEDDPDRPHWSLTFPDDQTLEIGPASHWQICAAAGERIHGA